jgi:ADP-heptose:LPS heptosyltransferase
MDDENQDILDMVRRAENEAQRLAARALIIQPGAVGDCILTLPLAEFLKTHLGIGSILMLGKSHYIDYFPGRTCIDGITDIDSVELHRLFVKSGDFELQDDDSLINVFAGYRQIITFLGAAGGDFEDNLIFTAYCSNAAEVTTLQLKPLADFAGHITDFYFDSFISAQSLEVPPANRDLKKTYILETVGVKPGRNVAIIHPGSGGVSKCWHIDNFYMLAEQLCDENIKVVFILGPAEMEKFKRKTIDALGAIAPVLCELSLMEIFQVISCSNCFIGNDSGITHMAAAAGIPTIACFGPTDPAQYGPVGPQVWTFRFEPSDFNTPCPDKAQEAAKQALQCLTS